MKIIRMLESFKSDAEYEKAKNTLVSNKKLTKKQIRMLVDRYACYLKEAWKK